MGWQVMYRRPGETRGSTFTFEDHVWDARETIREIASNFPEGTLFYVVSAEGQGGIYHRGTYKVNEEGEAVKCDYFSSFDDPAARVLMRVREAVRKGRHRRRWELRAELDELLAKGHSYVLEPELGGERLPDLKRGVKGFREGKEVKLPFEYHPFKATFKGSLPEAQELMEKAHRLRQEIGAQDLEDVVFEGMELDEVDFEVLGRSASLGEIAEYIDSSSEARKARAFKKRLPELEDVRHWYEDL